MTATRLLARYCRVVGLLAHWWLLGVTGADTGPARRRLARALADLDNAIRARATEKGGD